ncbi:reverse transcriptase domain-containing protein [Tanacetum coccineum]
MSTNGQTPLSQPTSVVRNTLGKEPVPQDPGRPISDEALREYCDRNYHQILPIIAEKVHQEKAQQEKLKAVKARLNFEETSHHSESGTPIRRRGLKERLGPRYVRSRSGSPEPRRGRSESPKKKGSERKAVFKRLEKGVFHRLGDKGKSVSVYSDDSRRRSYHSSHRDTESCHQSSRSRTTEPASERRYNKRASSRRTEELSESEGSAGGHWKSKVKRPKSSVEDDLSQPWVCEETDPFTPRIRYFDFLKTRMPSHIKTYDGSEDPEDHLKIFQSAAKTERWAMPTWCHMFNSTLTGNARVWFDDLPKETIDSYDDLKKAFLENYLQQKKCIKDPVEIHNIRQRDGESTEEFVRRKDKVMAILMVQPWERVARQRITQSFSPNSEKKIPPLGEDEGMEGPMITEAEIGGYCVHPTTHSIGFSGEIIWPIRQIQLLITIGDEEHSALALMNFVVVRSPSPYNGIIGRPGVRKLQVVPSTVHGMLKIPVEGGVITLKTSRLVPLECAMVSGPERTLPANESTVEERIKVAINPEYPEHTIMIGSTLTKEGPQSLQTFSETKLGCFHLKPTDMTEGVQAHLQEHTIKCAEGMLFD